MNKDININKYQSPKNNKSKEMKKYISSLLIFSTLATGLSYVVIKNDDLKSDEKEVVETYQEETSNDYSFLEESYDNNKKKAVTSHGIFTLHGDSNQEKIANFLYEQGFNDAVVCGIMACMYQSSDFDPTVIGDGGCALGIIQWNKERKDALIAYCQANGYEPDSLEGQLSYFMYQLEIEQNKYYKMLYDFLETVPNTTRGAYDTAFRTTSYVLLPENCEIKACGRGDIAEYVFETIDETAIGADRMVRSFDSYGKSR